MEDNYFYRNFSNNQKKRIWIFTACAVFLCFLIFYGFFIKAPSFFPQNKILTIKNGFTLDDTAAFLDKNNVIQSQFFFKVFAYLFGGDKKIMAGDYVFNKRFGVVSIARKITSGQFGLVPQKVFLPEGTSVAEMAKILGSQIENFDTGTFLNLTEGKEGYLFPDTYYFLPNIKPAEVISAMERNFNDKMRTISDKIIAFKKPIGDIITMASLVEEEARTEETRKIVAGILWKRLAIGMPLQVDSVFPYINGKNTYQISVEDLQIDSPYNTYKYKGLPKGPITNPGLDAIVDTVTPTNTPYLYYLSDKAGNMHYASSFDQHVANKQKFLQ